ncbi:hypothetical protein pb186bvf_003406 [Paramecium bursaria]
MFSEIEFNFFIVLLFRFFYIIFLIFEIQQAIISYNKPQIKFLTNFLEKNHHQFLIIKIRHKKVIYIFFQCLRRYFGSIKVIKNSLKIFQQQMYSSNFILFNIVSQFRFFYKQNPIILFQNFYKFETLTQFKAFIIIQFVQFLI